jgi:hypothetical protein
MYARSPAFTMPSRRASRSSAESPCSDAWWARSFWFSARSVATSPRFCFASCHVETQVRSGPM